MTGGVPLSYESLIEQVQGMRTRRFSARVWNGCALAGGMDLELYNFLAAGSTSLPAFEEFAAQPDLQLADQPPGWYSLRTAERVRFLSTFSRGDSALQQQARDVAAFFEKQERPADLVLLAYANPRLARDRFEAKYRQADEAFDLNGCEALVEQLRPFTLLLPDGLRESIGQREDYLEGRVQFSPDFYRTTSFLRRDTMMDAITGVLNGPNRLLSVYGKGGSGKTAMLQWLIARRFLPENSKVRTPVARLDIDFLYRDLLVQQPWLALLSFADQLNPQLPQRPFQSLMGPEERALKRRLHNRSQVTRVSDDEALSRTGSLQKDLIQSKFVAGIGANKALLIIDTVEELWLHLPAVLGALLAMLDQIQERCTNLRVILSGRYKAVSEDRELPGLADARRVALARLPDLEITKFSDEEAERFLVEVRHLDRELQPIAEIVAASHGNPFVLSLFAELASGRILEKQEVREAKVQFAYLIERIIDRIPDEAILSTDPAEEQRRKRTQSALRWMMRYGVVRRQLPKQFAEAVVFPFVRDAVREKETSDNANNLALAGRKYEGTHRWHSRGDALFEDVWSALQSYASTSSWISGTGSELTLQPEIVVPMRQLLTQNADKYPIFRLLNEKAAEYFEGLANKGATGKMLSAALLHRFQGEGPAARRWMEEYLVRCRRSDESLAAVQELADSLFTEEYRDDERKPVMHSATEAIFDDRLLADAALETFLAAMMRFIRKPELRVSTLRPTMEARYRDLRDSKPDQENPRVRLAHYAALVLDLQASILGSPPVKFTELSNADEKVAAMLLNARSPGNSNVQLSFAEVPGSPFFPNYFLRSERGRLGLLAGRTDDAFEDYLSALRMALSADADVEEVSTLMLKVGDLGYPLGRFQEIENCATQVANLGFPAHEEATGWLLRLAIDRCDLRQAHEMASQFESQIQAARQEMLFDEAAASLRFNAVAEIYGGKGPYDPAANPSAAALMQLKYARFYLDGWDLPKRSASTIESLGHGGFPEPLVELEYHLLRLRQFSHTGEMDRAKGCLEKAISLIDSDHRVPGAYRLIAFATWLAEGGSGDQELDAFFEELNRAHPNAQVAAMRPFFFGKPEARAKDTPVADRIGDLLRTRRPGHDAGPYGLWTAAGLIYFSQNEAALDVLRGLLSPETYQFSLMAGVYRIASRIGPQAMYEDPGWIGRCVSESGDRREYACIALIEAGERMLAGHRLDLLKACYEAAARFISTVPTESGWYRRFQALEAGLDHERTATDAFIGLLASLPIEKLVRSADRVAISTEKDEIIFHATPMAITSSIERRLNRDHSGAAKELVSADAYDLYPSDLTTVMGLGSDGFAQSIVDWTFRLTRRALPSLGLALLRYQLIGMWPRLELFGFPDTSVETRQRAVSAVPWELVRRRRNRFSRTAQDVVAVDTLRWMQRAIREIGPPPSGQWDDFVALLGGPSRFRAELLNRLAPGQISPVMILEPNPERRRKARTGYGAAGLQLDLTYLAQGFQSIPVSLDSELLYAASPQSFPSVIHVAAQLSESYQPREVLLGAGESADAVRPDMLISLFSRWPEDRLRPFVILECIESPSDRGRGLLLRNALASRLFAECTRGVLAIGPYPKGWLNQTIKALLSKMHDPKVAIGDLHTAFWAEVRYPPPALFTLDPDLPVWER